MSIGQTLESGSMRAMIQERDDAYAELERGGRPGVSVVIPCFNQVEYLDESLASVLDQTVNALEVIVVDDGSSEDVKSKVEWYATQQWKTPVRYVRVTNRGLPGARNTGLMLARGEAFLPLDADDWIEPSYIERTYPLLQEGADVVVPGLQEHGPTRNGTYMPGYDRPLEQVTVEVMWEFNRTFYCSLFRTRLLREVGGYNGRMVLGFEDYDLAVDLMTRGAKYVAANEVLFHYRTRPDGMLTDAMARQQEIMAEMHRHHGV